MSMKSLDFCAVLWYNVIIFKYIKCMAINTPERVVGYGTLIKGALVNLLVKPAVFAIWTTPKFVAWDVPNALLRHNFFPFRNPFDRSSLVEDKKFHLSRRVYDALVKTYIIGTGLGVYSAAASQVERLVTGDTKYMNSFVVDTLQESVFQNWYELSHLIAYHRFETNGLYILNERIPVAHIIEGALSWPVKIMEAGFLNTFNYNEWITRFALNIGADHPAIRSAVETIGQFEDSYPLVKVALPAIAIVGLAISYKRNKRSQTRANQPAPVASASRPESTLPSPTAESIIARQKFELMQNSGINLSEEEMNRLLTNLYDEIESKGWLIERKLLSDIHNATTDSVLRQKIQNKIFS